LWHSLGTSSLPATLRSARLDVTPAGHNRRQLFLRQERPTFDGSRVEALVAGAPRRLRGRLPAPLRDVERRVMLARPSHPEAGARRRGVAASRNRFPHLPRRRARSWSPTSGSTSRCRAARAAHQGGSLNTARSAETAVAAEANPKAERKLLQRSRASFPALQSVSVNSWS
jgi:hypothetical protein